MPKIFDCFTFFDENFLVNSRFEILNDVVDYFVIVESTFDHQGKKKDINFKLQNYKYKNKVRHIIHDSKNLSSIKGWEAEKLQREKLFEGIKDAKDDDIILFSDSDEIPNPELLKNIFLNKKYAIFLQKFFVYKLNVYNEHESPWEGTRACLKKNLKSFYFLRKKIVKKNLVKPFWKFHLEKNIQIIGNGGWHFNNLYSVENISKKLKAAPHQEFSSDKFSSEKAIKDNISKLQDLYGRNHKYKKVPIDDSYPKFFQENSDKFKDYIL